VINILSAAYVDEETMITLDASQTSDAEGDMLSYSWVQVSGIDVELTETTNNQLTFTSPSVTTNEILSFELTVDDGIDSVSSTIEMTVYQINKAPTISINSHAISSEEKTTITISTQGNDPDNDKITYTWQQISGPNVAFTQTNSSQVTVILPDVSNDETIALKVTVSDGTLSASATTSMTVLNKKSGGSMVWLLLLIVMVRLKTNVKIKQVA